MQLEGAALEGAAGGEPVGGEAPQEEVQAMEGATERARPSGGRKKTHSLPANLKALLQRSSEGAAGIDSLAGLADWRHKQRHGVGGSTV